MHSTRRNRSLLFGIIFVIITNSSLASGQKDMLHFMNNSQGSCHDQSFILPVKLPNDFIEIGKFEEARAKADKRPFKILLQAFMDTRVYGAGDKSHTTMIVCLRPASESQRIWVQCTGRKQLCGSFKVQTKIVVRCVEVMLLD